MAKKPVPAKPLRMPHTVNNKPAPKYPKPGCVIAFEHINYQGRWALICSSYPNLNKIGFKNIISSIKIAHHVVVNIYQHINYKGDMMALYHNEANLKNRHYIDRTILLQFDGKKKLGNLNNKVSAIRVFFYADAFPVRPKKGCARIFERSNYQGDSMEVCFSHPNLQITDYHHGTSSIWVGPHTDVVLYEDIKYGGKKVEFTKDHANITSVVSHRWLASENDSVRVFSMKLVCKEVRAEVTK